MIEVITEDNKVFKIFCMKDPDYVTKIMVSWMTLDKTEGIRARSYFIDTNGTEDKKQFKHRKGFGIHFRYIHQVDNHNNWRNSPASLERIWVTKFWPDCNFAWYLAVLDVITALASGHFQNDWVVQPSLNF